MMHAIERNILNFAEICLSLMISLCYVSNMQTLVTRKNMTQNCLPGLNGFLSDESDFRRELEVCQVTCSMEGLAAFQLPLNDDGLWMIVDWGLPKHAKTLGTKWVNLSIQSYEGNPFLTFIVHSYRV